MAGHFFLQLVLFRTTLWYGQPPHGKKGPVGRSGHTKEHGPVAMVPVTTNNRTRGQNSHF